MKTASLIFLLLSGAAQAQSITVNPSLGLSGASAAITCTSAGVCTLAAVSTIATSLAIGGATIGSNALAVTGAAQISGSVGVGVAPIGKITFAAADFPAAAFSMRYAIDTTYGYDWRVDVAGGLLRLDTVNAGVYSTNPAITVIRNTALVGIGTNAPGKQLDVVGSFRASTEVTMLSLTAASGTPSSICQNAATKEITVNAALTCTVSGRQFKHDINPIEVSALDLIRGIEPSSFIYNDSTIPRWGFIAEQVASVDRKFGDGWDGDAPKSIDQNAILAVVVKALQELKADNDNLREEVRQRAAR